MSKKNVKLKPYEASNSGLTFIGKTQDGEFVAGERPGREHYDVYCPVYAENTGDDQNYIEHVGHYSPKDIRPLTKRDKAFLDEAYSANIGYCTECNTAWDTEDDHYGSCEFQWTEDGLVCKACFADYVKDRGLDEYVDEPSKCLPLEAAEALAESGKLTFIERFIGGMTDGRGGSFGGERVREGMPKDVFKFLKRANPKARYVFTHDESGQFQTYWSVWQVSAEGSSL